jgi:hypothetical protein
MCADSRPKNGKRVGILGVSTKYCVEQAKKVDLGHWTRDSVSRRHRHFWTGRTTTDTNGRVVFRPAFRRERHELLRIIACAKRHIVPSKRSLTGESRDLAPWTIRSLQPSRRHTSARNGLLLPSGWPLFASLRSDFACGFAKTKSPKQMSLWAGERIAAWFPRLDISNGWTDGNEHSRVRRVLSTADLSRPAGTISIHHCIPISRPSRKNWATNS